MTTDTTPAQVREAIARSASDAGTPGEPVERETHISHVFLCGERAYKLKKPVVLPFLDAGTVSRRRELCRDEVRLNRRLAPDIYLGVRAVIEGPDGWELAGEDAAGAVEYVVEMRRYDERATLAARLARGELRRADVVAVARRLAAFHEDAPAVAASGAASPALERRVFENLHQLLAVVDQRGEVEHVLALERFAHAFVIAHAEGFEARARQGRIREGHGDLRAEHVLLDDGVQIVDCVEFDQRLREADVGDDLAFLLMDLVAGGGERFAPTLLRAYRDAGGDPGDDATLSFHASQRALVRAKVALVRAAQQPPASAAHGHESAAARELVAVAERFAWHARLPLALVVCGVPASGKSYLGERLAGISGLALLSSDVTRKRLAGLAPAERADAGAYRAEYNRLTYAELGRRAAREIAARGGVLVDATFRHRADRDVFAAAFGTAAPVVFVECVAPAGVLAKRARERERDPGRVSDATSDVVLREREGWEPLDEVPAQAHIMVRTDRPAQDALADVLAGLDGRIGRLRPGAPPPP